MALRVNNPADFLVLDETTCALGELASAAAWLAAQSEGEQRKMIDTLRQLLTHYLATGRMLRP